jgi:choline-sulfatase
MGGNHRMMSKCVLYEPAVRVPLIIRPPGGRPQAVVDSLVEHLDVPATVREIAGAPDIALSEGRSLLADVHDPVSAASSSRSVTVSENWGFAAFETERYKLVVDEDAVTPCQLFDLFEDAAEDHDLLPDPTAGPVVEELMEAHVRPFFFTPPARPIPSIFTGGYD